MGSHLIDNKKIRFIFILICWAFLTYIFAQKGLISYGAESTHEKEVERVEVIFNKIFELNQEAFKKLRTLHSDEEIRMLFDDYEKRIDKYVSVLLKNRSQSIELSEKYLLDDDSHKRSIAAYLLGKLDAKESYKILLKQLDTESDFFVFGKIILSLGEIEANDSLSQLEKLLFEIKKKSRFSDIQKEKLEFMIKQTIDKIHREESNDIKYESAPLPYLTKDRRYFIIQAFAECRVIDKNRFLFKLRNNDKAIETIDEVLSTSIQEEILNYEYLEINELMLKDLEQRLIRNNRAKFEQYGIKFISLDLVEKTKQD